MVEIKASDTTLDRCKDREIKRKERNDAEMKSRKFQQGFKKYITRDNEPNHQRMITGCLAVEDDDANKEIFELNEIGHKESLERIHLAPNLTEEYQEELAKLVDEFNDLFTSDPGMSDVIQHQIQLTSEDL